MYKPDYNRIHKLEPDGIDLKEMTNKINISSEPCVAALRVRRTQ